MKRRMPAKRMFAAEIYSGKPVNGKLVSAAGRAFKRVFVTGVLVDVTERDGVVKAQIFDGTGKLTVFCSKYQPEALVAIKSIEYPTYVAVVGRVSEVDGKIFVRPEFVNEITAEEHTLWLKEAIFATSKSLKRITNAEQAEDEEETDEVETENKEDKAEPQHTEEERQRILEAIEKAKARLQELTAS